MSYAMETTDDVAGGESQYLSEPGTYHCVVTDVKENQGPKGGAIDGFTVELSVLAGTSEGQKDKQTSLCLFSPDASKSEKSQEWARKKQTAFVIAAGLLDLSKLGGKVNVDLSKARGKQIVLTFDNNEYEGKSNLQLAWASIFHVDDPRAAKFPKDKEALTIIPKADRKDASYFDPILKKSKKKPSQGSRLSQDELSDL
jgi:hypothetical protein